MQFSVSIASPKSLFFFSQLSHFIHTNVMFQDVVHHFQLSLLHAHRGAVSQRMQFQGIRSGSVRRVDQGRASSFIQPFSRCLISVHMYQTLCYSLLKRQRPCNIDMAVGDLLESLNQADSEEICFRALRDEAWHLEARLCQVFLQQYQLPHDQ